MRLRFAAAVALVVLTSCVSTPELALHTLDLRPSTGLVTEVNLEVGRFTVVQRLDRPQILIQESPTRVTAYAENRWAGNLGEMVSTKLTAEFGQPVAGRRTLKVAGRVTGFEQLDGAGSPRGRVRLDVEIRDRETRAFEAPLWAASYESVQSANGGGVDAVVRALSRAVEEIAADIAADAEKL